MEYLSGFFKHDQGMIYDMRQTEVCQSFFLIKHVLSRCVTDSGRCWSRRTADFTLFELLTCSYSSIIYLQDHKHCCLFLLFFSHLLKFLCPPPRRYMFFCFFVMWECYCFMSERTAGPPLAPLQPRLWQNRSWAKVTAEALLIAKHPSESEGRNREQLPESAVKLGGGELISNLGICNISLSSKAAEEEFGSCFSFPEAFLCASHNSDWFKCQIMLCSDILPTPCGVCVHLYKLVWSCLCESVCVCVVSAGEHARTAAVWLHCCKC